MPSPLPSTVRSSLFAQLAAMEKAGLPADRAWALIQLPKVPQARMQAVSNAIARGASPAVTAQKAGLFTPLEASLVRAALAAGSPLHVYQRLAQTCAQRASNEGKVRSGMVLPIAMLILALLIGPVPQLVAGTLTAGAYLLHVLKPLLALAGLAYVFSLVKASASASAWPLTLPLVGKAIARENALYFFESLALLLEAGVAMFEALPTAVASIENAAIRKAYARLKPAMQRGAPLSQALVQKIADPMYLGNADVLEFIATGEGSGTLPEMLFRHVNTEAESLALYWANVAAWAPRIAYSVVAAWMAYGLLTGGGFGTREATVAETARTTSLLISIDQHQARG
jgi:general secretion pathway protein F